MEIHEVIRFFRKKLHFTQKEMLPDLDPSVYSRIESGKQELKITDLKNIMNTLSLVEEEVFLNFPLDKKQSDFKALFYYCSRNLKNLKKKQRLLNYYEELSTKNKNLKELSNYLAIKSYFAQFWEEIETITRQELIETYQLLIDKNYYQRYDYVIIVNIIRLLDKKQADLIVNKIFTLKQLNGEVAFLNTLVQSILLNVLTVRIYEKDYEGGRKYIHLARKLDTTQQNFSYQTNLKYLENLLDYVMTGDYHYMQRIQEYINLLKDIGNQHYAKQIESEIKVVIHDILDHTSRSNFPVSLIKT